MPSLAERLALRISRDGPISFAEFMDAALYDPEAGYYARLAPIGERGDFSTAPSISPAFAAVIAREFRREAEAFEGAVDFVEAGAGDGQFLEDFAAALHAQSPSFAARVRLTAVETSARARERLRARPFDAAPRVLEGAERLDTGSVSGWIFSNELFDALPVVCLEGSPAGLQELCVALENGRFGWARRAAPETWIRHLASFGIVLEHGQRGEIAPRAAPLYRQLARALGRGSLVTFDYGHRASVLYHPLARRGGTLAVHSRGRRGGDPLGAPGDVDLTAHVNWDELARAGEAEGLRTAGIFRQGAYLARGGLLEFAQNDAEKWRAFRLIDPEGMGEELSALRQIRPS